MAVQEKLRLGEDDEVATEWMQQLIQESSMQVMAGFMEATHRIAQALRQCPAQQQCWLVEAAVPHDSKLHTRQRPWRLQRGPLKPSREKSQHGNRKHCRSQHSLGNNATGHVSARSLAVAPSNCTC